VQFDIYRISILQKKVVLLGDTYNNLNKKVIKSILHILVLQSIKDEPMSGNKILNEINSRFNALLSPASVYSALSSLQDQGLIATNPGKMPTLTKKGETVRQKLIEDYSKLQKTIEINF